MAQFNIVLELTTFNPVDTDDVHPSDEIVFYLGEGRSETVVTVLQDGVPSEKLFGESEVTVGSEPAHRRVQESASGHYDIEAPIPDEKAGLAAAGKGTMTGTIKVGSGSLAKAS